MRITIDSEKGTLESDGGTEALYSDEAFRIISDLWVKVGWNQKYAYTFSWLGRPIIQLPEDMVRTQEMIYRIKPTVIVETGVAHGGSLIYYASLLQLMGGGKVIGVDIEIRQNNRAAIERHEMAKHIKLIEGDSVSAHVVGQVRAYVGPQDRVLVILDSNHTKAHVAAELAAYSDLVTPGSYIVATDGIMSELNDVPRGSEEWSQDNPSAAAREFAEAHPEFILEQPDWVFNESTLNRNITHWPEAWLRRT